MFKDVLRDTRNTVVLRTIPTEKHCKTQDKLELSKNNQHVMCNKII